MWIHRTLHISFISFHSNSYIRVVLFIRLCHLAKVDILPSFCRSASLKISMEYLQESSLVFFQNCFKDFFFYFNGSFKDFGDVFFKSLRILWEFCEIFKDFLSIFMQDSLKTLWDSLQILGIVEYVL